MSAYIVVEVTVKDPEKFQDYREMVPPTLEVYGGKFLVRGGHTEQLEGDRLPARFVVIEFENAERAKAWLNSDEYRDARALRHAAAETNMFVVEGV